MSIKKKTVSFLLTLLMVLSFIPNIPARAESSGIIYKKNTYNSLDACLAQVVSEHLSNGDDAIISLNGMNATINTSVTFDDVLDLVIEGEGTLTINAPIIMKKGARFCLHVPHVIINCNNAIQIDGYSSSEAPKSGNDCSSLELEAFDKNNPICIESGSGCTTNMFKITNNGYVYISNWANDKNCLTINNNYANCVFNGDSAILSLYDMVINSKYNGIIVTNEADMSWCDCVLKNIEINADKTAIKATYNGTKDPLEISVKSVILESKETLLDQNGNIRTYFRDSSDTAFKSREGYSAKCIINGGKFTCKWNSSTVCNYDNVSFNVSSNSEIDMGGAAGKINNFIVTGSNNEIDLNSEKLSYNNLSISSNNTVNISDSIFNCAIPTTASVESYMPIIVIDGKTLVNSYSISNYLNSRDPLDIGDTIKIEQSSYTLPVIEDRQWLNSSQTAVTKATYNANDTNIYTLAEKPCEHETTEIRNAVEPTCTETGYSGDTYCTHCNELIQRGSTVAAKGHNPSSTSTKEVLPTCTETGNKEYWTCTRCKKIFKDANCTQETTLAERTYNALGHNLLPTDEVPATCISTGIAKYWTCDRCNKIFADENGTTETTLDNLVTPIATKGHALVHHEEVPATCTTAGTKEYYECTMCNKKFSDSTCNTELTNLTITPKGHKYELITAVEPTCTENGNIECYTCTNTNCGKYFKDENGNKIEISANQVIVPKLGHIEGTATRENETPATCTENGSYNEVVRCTRCKEVISSTPKTIVTEGHDWSEWTVVTPATEISVGSETRYCSKCSTTETRDIPKINHVHDFKSVSAVNPTCTENGNIAYVECKDCHKKYTDTTAATELNDEDIVLTTKGHDLVKHEAVEAKWEDGNIEYYSCKNCDKLFDKNNNEVTSVVIPKPDYEKVNVTKTNNYITKVRLTQNTNPTFEYSVDGIIKAEITESIPLMTDSGTVYEKTITISPLDNGNAIVLIKSPFNNAIIEGFDCTATIEVVNICNHDNAYQHNRVEPTCEEDGNIEYYECPTCGKLFTDDTFATEITDEKDLIIEATGHLEKLITTVSPATCTENGYESTMTVCEKCGKTLNSGTIVVTEQALGHDEKEYHKALAPDCTANGYEEIEYICDRCGEHTRDTVRNVIPAVGHNKSNTIYNAETDDTFEYYFCPQCQKHFDTDFNEISETDIKKQHIDPPIMTNLSECSITGCKDAIYTGNAIKPTIKITHNGYTLKENLDYKLTYKNYLNVGKASVTITGLNSFTGSVTKYYNITARSISTATISGVPSYKIFTGSAIKPTITIKYKDKVVKTTNYTINYNNTNVNVGTATITITGKGNFKGTVKKTFKINPKKATIKSVTAGTKSFTVKWTPQKTKMKTSYITGYQIQYSTDKNFAKNNKIVTATKYSTSSKTIKNLTAKKIYYVRIRTYKTVNNVKYYSAWSNTLKVKTK